MMGNDIKLEWDDENGVEVANDGSMWIQLSDHGREAMDRAITSEESFALYLALKTVFEPEAQEDG